MNDSIRRNRIDTAKSKVLEALTDLIRKNWLTQEEARDALNEILQQKSI